MEIISAIAVPSAAETYAPQASEPIVSDNSVETEIQEESLPVEEEHQIDEYA